MVDPCFETTSEGVMSNGKCVKTDSSDATLQISLLECQPSRPTGAAAPYFTNIGTSLFSEGATHPDISMRMNPVFYLETNSKALVHSHVTEDDDDIPLALRGWTQRSSGLARLSPLGVDQEGILKSKTSCSKMSIEKTNSFIRASSKNVTLGALHDEDKIPLGVGPLNINRHHKKIKPTTYDPIRPYWRNSYELGPKIIFGGTIESHQKIESSKLGIRLKLKHPYKSSVKEDTIEELSFHKCNRPLSGCHHSSLEQVERERANALASLEGRV
ncbi:hypothetical protein CROQUDRAFT_658914 [Cronartium quercuum f. sp. fusiforme G11]|uniref:Uncharacterized protein n=1 Tax=Cronartium quercuum f. sp. fusiforme G11 TaxID=708437 RepID=A0A9P6NJL5_9BASI|nr:hypothetical protein CROQUDRAFT_658914 [Cronartium quercuum f. sp. fusiforme G11]